MRSELVSDEKYMEGDSVTIWCAHRDTVLYPAAEVKIVLDGRCLQVEDAVSDTLPMSVLLGTDIQNYLSFLGTTHAVEVCNQVLTC